MRNWSVVAALTLGTWGAVWSQHFLLSGSTLRLCNDAGLIQLDELRSDTGSVVRWSPARSLATGDCFALEPAWLAANPTGSWEARARSGVCGDAVAPAWRLLLDSLGRATCPGGTADRMLTWGEVRDLFLGNATATAPIAPLLSYSGTTQRDLFERDLEYLFRELAAGGPHVRLSSGLPALVRAFANHLSEPRLSLQAWWGELPSASLQCTPEVAVWPSLPNPTVATQGDTAFLSIAGSERVDWHRGGANSPSSPSAPIASSTLGWQRDRAAITLVRQGEELLYASMARMDGCGRRSVRTIPIAFTPLPHLSQVQLSDRDGDGRADRLQLLVSPVPGVSPAGPPLKLSLEGAGSALVGALVAQEARPAGGLFLEYALEGWAVATVGDWQLRSEWLDGVGRSNAEDAMGPILLEAQRAENALLLRLSEPGGVDAPAHVRVDGVDRVATEALLRSDGWWNLRLEGALPAPGARISLGEGWSDRSANLAHPDNPTVKLGLAGEAGRAQQRLLVEELVQVEQLAAGSQAFAEPQWNFVAETPRLAADRDDRLMVKLVFPMVRPQAEEQRWSWQVDIFTTRGEVVASRKGTFTCGEVAPALCSGSGGAALLEIPWLLRSEAGRTVGSGSYVVQATLRDPGAPVIQETLRVGVLRAAR